MTVHVGETADYDGDPYTREWRVMSSRVDFVEEIEQKTGNE